MRIVIASTFVPFVYGGGTKIVDDLALELKRHGFQVDTVLTPFYSWWQDLKEQTLALRLLDLSESSGNRIDRLITVRYPSYALRHPHKIAWFIHHHREAYDLWDSQWNNIPKDTIGEQFREELFASDTLYLNECKKIYTNSLIIKNRLKYFNNKDADGVLYPPLPSDHPFVPGEFRDYIFYPSRLNQIKRQDLAIQAMQHVPDGLKLVIAGIGEDPKVLEGLQTLATNLHVADRIHFTGYISEQQKAEWMQNCCGCLYLAFDEDSYGYVTLEAFHSAKPVITLNDSGGTLEVIEHGRNGLIAEPTPESLADAMTQIWSNRSKSIIMGKEAQQTIYRFRITWDHVIERLTA